jgi:hypothetical protein
MERARFAGSRFSDGLAAPAGRDRQTALRV